MFRIKNKMIQVQHEYPVSVILERFKEHILFKSILSGDCIVWTHIEHVALTTGSLGVTKSIVVKLI